MINKDSVRIIFRLDEDTASKLLDRSKKEDIQQTKLIKTWLQESINGKFYKYPNNSKLNRNITFYISSTLISQIDEKANQIGVTRSSYIYNILYRKLSLEDNYKTDQVELTKFDYYFLNGKYAQLIELVKDRIELLDNSSLVNYGLSLVLLARNSKAKEIVNTLKTRLDVRDDNLISEISREQGWLLVLQSRLARAIDSAYKAGIYARKAVDVGTVLKDNELIAQASLRLASSYLGVDDFKNAMENIERAKKHVDISKHARTLVSAYLLEAYVYLYNYQFDKVLDCVKKGKFILEKHPQDYYKAELLYIQLRVLYLTSNNQEQWMSILSDIIKLINITGSEFLRISTYNETAAFFLKFNNMDIGLSYLMKAKKLENIYFNYAYQKSSYSNIMHMSVLAKYDLNYFSDTINKFIDARKFMKDNYISYEYLDASANLFYSSDESRRINAIKKLENLKINKISHSIAEAAKVSLEERRYLFIR